jgi:hypothetical protein
MRLEAKNLIFISKIERDGSGIKILTEEEVLNLQENSLWKNELYNLLPLSITLGTYVAQNMNVYVVKLKKKL